MYQSESESARVHGTYGGLGRAECNVLQLSSGVASSVDSSGSQEVVLKAAGEMHKKHDRSALFM